MTGIGVSLTLVLVFLATCLPQYLANKDAGFQDSGLEDAGFEDTRITASPSRRARALTYPSPVEFLVCKFTFMKRSYCRNLLSVRLFPIIILPLKIKSVLEVLQTCSKDLILAN